VTGLVGAVEGSARAHPDVVDVEIWKAACGKIGLNVATTCAANEALVTAELRARIAREVGYQLGPEVIRILRRSELDPGETLDRAALARARAGRTKRSRTRAALLRAAREAFSSTGWLETRMEHVAARAGVSVATAYNYFPSKYALIGHVFGPLVVERQVAARATLRDTAPVDALVAHLVDLAILGREHNALAVAFVCAVNEYTAKVGGPPRPDDADDPRNAAPFPDLVVELVDTAQRRGELRRWPPAFDAATTATNVMLLRFMTRPHETAAETAEVGITTLFGMLAPDRLTSTTARRPFRRQIERLTRTKANVGGSPPP
jgi:AcrR family transcriptional regulator